MAYVRKPLTFSIVNELKSRWASNHLATARMKDTDWRRLLLDLRAYWRMEVETVLETRFYEPIKGTSKSENTKQKTARK
jgi:hypothetical protein